MSYGIIQWGPAYWDISKLKPYDKNPRIITESGLLELNASFTEIGVAQPINVNTDGTILSGHARWMSLKERGFSKVLVLVPNRTLTPKQEEAVIVRMNKNIAGSWDFDVLANQFEIQDLLDWGFKEWELSGDDWDSDVGAMDKIAEDDSGVLGKIKITCPQDLKDEVFIYLKAKLLETSFEGVHIE